MQKKIQTVVMFLLSFMCFFLVNSILPISNAPLPTAQAQVISVPNPLAYNDVTSLSTQIRSYLLLIVGGIAIVFIAVAGILYIIGGATMNDGLITMAKKGLIGAIAGVVIVTGASVVLSEVYYIVLGKQLNDFNSLSASQILFRLVNFLLAILGTLFLIAMIVGGIWYFAAGADESKVELGKKTIQNSIIGLVIAVAAMIILRQVSVLVTGSAA